MKTILATTHFNSLWIRESFNSLNSNWFHCRRVSALLDGATTFDRSTKSQMTFTSDVKKHNTARPICTSVHLSTISCLLVRMSVWLFYRQSVCLCTYVSAPSVPAPSALPRMSLPVCICPYVSARLSLPRLFLPTCLSLPICLSPSISACLSLSICPICVCLSVYARLSIYSFVPLSITPYVWLPACPSVNIYICLSFSFYVCLSISLSFSLSICPHCRALVIEA